MAISTDGQVSIDLITPPYHRGTFTRVPMNLFSIMLFMYLGEITEDLYKKYIKIFKETIVLESSPGITYMESLSDGDLWENAKTTKDPFGTIVELIEENSTNYTVLAFLLDFFNLNAKVYSGSKNIMKNGLEDESAQNMDAVREIYIYLLNDKFYPILIREIDGDIKVMSELF